MALFDNYTPEETFYRRSLQYDGNLFGKISLALSGYKTDGTDQNFIGKVNNVASPVLGGVVGGIIGSYAGDPVAGVKAGVSGGQFLNNVKGGIADSVLYGTQQTQTVDYAKENQDKVNNVIDSLTSIGGSIYGALNSGQSDINIDQSSIFSMNGEPVVDSSNFGKTSDSFMSLSNMSSIPFMFRNGGELIDPILSSAGEISVKETDLYRTLFDTFGDNLDVTGVVPNVKIEDSVLESVTPEDIVGPGGNPNSSGIERKYTSEITDDIYTLIAQAENPKDVDLFAPYIYERSNSVGPGHFGKYQFSAPFVEKYYGKSPEEYLKDYAGQEESMRRRMDDLKTEVKSFFEKTGSDIGWNDAALLIHFQGLPNAIKKQQAGDFDSKTSINPSVNGYLERAYGGLLNKHGGEISDIYAEMDRDGYYPNHSFDSKVTKTFYVDGEKVEISIDDPSYRLYGPEEYDEDLYIVSKKEAEQIGINDILNMHSLGQMRFGERIFDQDANIFLKGITLDESISESEKADKIGKYILDEMKTHNDIANILYRKEDDESLNSSAYNYAKGGETGPKKPSKKELERLDEIIRNLETSDNIAAADALRVFTQDVRLSGFPSGVTISDVENATSQKPADEVSVDDIKSFSIESKTFDQLYNDTGEFKGPLNSKGIQILNSSTTPDKQTGVLSDQNSAQISSLQQYYNKFAEDNGFKTIPVNGVLDDRTSRAILNLQSYGVDIKTSISERLDTDTGDLITDITGIGITGKNGVVFDALKYAPTNFSVEDLSKEDFVPGEAPIIDPNDPYFVPPGSESMFPELTGTSQDALFAAIGGNPLDAASKEKKDPLNPFDTQNTEPPKVKSPIFNNGSVEDIAGILAGTALANTELPQFSETEDYVRLRNELSDISGEGFSQANLSNFLSSINNQASTAVQGLANSGGTQGQISAALSNISSGIGNAEINFMLADEQLADQRLSRFANFVTSDQGRSDRLTEIERRIAEDKQTIGAALIGETLQNRADRNQFDALYGQGSSYSKLIDAQSEAIKRSENDLSALLNSVSSIL